MKFLPFLSTIITISILLFIIPTNACEQSCRTGISLAFGDNYSKEVAKEFETLKSNLKVSLFSGYTGPISSSARSACYKTIDEEVDGFEKDFTGSFATLIEDSIFKQTPQFRGQCQHPLRVNQPPPGVAWTMEDCKNQDYICGNPPAICHFMDQYVKPRNVKNVKESLEARLDSNGSFFNSIVKGVVISGIKSNIKAIKLPEFTTTVETNILSVFEDFIKHFKNTFCKGTTCDKYDHDIKVKLLSYP
jgi:hypothetical protein